MYTFTDLQTAGLILACIRKTTTLTNVEWVTAYKGGEEIAYLPMILNGEEMPLFSAAEIAYAKKVFSYFAKEAWRYKKQLNKTLKEAWKYILDNAKELDRINEARRKAKQLDKQAAQRTAQTKPPFSFRSNVPPVVATYGQTGRQLEKGKPAKERHNEIPTIKTKISRYYDR